VVYFDIGKQKVVWILKHREQHEEAAGNALRPARRGCKGTMTFTRGVSRRPSTPLVESLRSSTIPSVKGGLWRLQHLPPNVGQGEPIKQG
jgi:hypothetical protein